MANFYKYVSDKLQNRSPIVSAQLFFLLFSILILVTCFQTEMDVSENSPEGADETDRDVTSPRMSRVTPPMSITGANPKRRHRSGGSIPEQKGTFYNIVPFICKHEWFIGKKVFCIVTIVCIPLLID